MSDTGKTREKKFFFDIEQLTKANEQFKNIAEIQKELRKKHDAKI
ncbi:MAG TPA: hypothetical protein VLB45_05530 [Nitrosopumilaceae archaeon]|nr:hypothetical protein [Nitrosopumilaceae archaeon]